MFEDKDNSSCSSVAEETSPEKEQRSDKNKCRDFLLHDLKGPIVNMRGFTELAIESLAELQVLLEENKPGMGAEQIKFAHDLTVEDLQPFLSFINQAIATLDERIQRYQND